MLRMDPDDPTAPLGVKFLQFPGFQLICTQPMMQVFPDLRTTLQTASQ
jgi:hypothetical protein